MPRTKLALPSLTAILLLLGGVAAQVPCYEANRGVNLGLGFAQVQVGQPLGFSFPTPTGSVSAISISSLGFVWLGSNGSPGIDVSPQQFAGSSRIAAMWSLALDPSTGPGVFFNSLPASGSNPARAVITWEASDGSGGPMNLVQLQMLDSGTIVIHHRAGNGVTSFSSLVGVSDFGSSVPADFSTASYLPLASGTNPALFDYQPFIVSVGPTYDLAGMTFELIPNGQGGYLCIERTSCRSGGFDKVGTGCPKPSTFYEFFPPGTGADYSNQSFHFAPNGLGGWLGTSSTSAIQPFSNNLGFGSFGVAYAQNLPFPWPHPGGVANTIDICADGFVWLASDVNHYSPCCDGDIPQFLALGEPCLAPIWLGLDPSAPGAGCFFDTAPGGGSALITWSNCALMNGPGTATCQLALFPDGSFELRYGTVSPGGEAVLIGYSLGTADDPGNRDLTTLPWNSGVGGAPMLSLQATPGTLPSIGTTFGVDIGGFVTPAIGVLAFGGYGDFDLAPLATGCRGYLDFSSAGTFVYVGLTVPYSFSFALPNVSAFVGLNVFLQAVELRSGVNSLGLAFSNGGVMRVGN